MDLKKKQKLWQNMIGVILVAKYINGVTVLKLFHLKRVI